MAIAFEGADSLAQKYISDSIASNFYSKTPFLSALGGVSLIHRKTDPLRIGRPYDDNLNRTGAKGEILSGTRIDPAQKMSIYARTGYMSRIQTAVSANGKNMGQADTMPTVANWGTAAHSTLTQAAAETRWSRIVVPILLRNSDLRLLRGGSSSGNYQVDLARLISDSTEIAYQETVDKLNTQVWSGNPTSQDALLWDQGLGLQQWIDSSNICARVDRSVSANAAWRAKKYTNAFPCDIAKIINFANLGTYISATSATGLGLGKFGNGVNLVICDAESGNYQKIKSQVLANGGSIMLNGISNMGQYGVEREVLRKDNAYIMYDPSCPSGYVYLLDLKTFKFIVHPEDNFRVTEFVDISKYSSGAMDATQAFINLQWMLVCDNPGANGVLTNVS